MTLLSIANQWQAVFLLEARRSDTPLRSVLRLDSGDGDIVVVLSRQDLLLGNSTDTSRCIFVAVSGRFVVPFESSIEVLRHVDAQLVEISHGEFCIRESRQGGPLRINVGNLFVLWEDLFVSDQKPLADSHFRFWLTLSCC